MRTLSDRNLALVIAVLAALWLAMLLLGGPESHVDPGINDAAHLPGLVPAAALVTRLGDWTALLPLALAATVFLVLRGFPKRGAVLLLMVVAGRLLVELQKAQFDRARPDPQGHLVAVHSMAFPSGHAAHSMTFWLGIALLAVASHRLRGPAVMIALLLTLLTGLSRLVLAVHWPSDVIGGWAFGAALALLTVRLALAVEPPHDVDGATGVTRVTGEDKPAGGGEPTLPRRD